MTVANERTKERVVAVLRHVIDHIDDYIPSEWLLEGSGLAVRVRGADEVPTVELDAVMPVLVEPPGE